MHHPRLLFFCIGCSQSGPAQTSHSVIPIYTGITSHLICSYSALQSQGWLFVDLTGPLKPCLSVTLALLSLDWWVGCTCPWIKRPKKQFFLSERASLFPISQVNVLAFGGGGFARKNEQQGRSDNYDEAERSESEKLLPAQYLIYMYAAKGKCHLAPALNSFQSLVVVTFFPWSFLAKR